MASPVRAVRRAFAEVPRSVVAATVAFALLLCVYSVAVPSNEGPDESAHADLIFFLASGGSYPAFDGRHMDVALIRTCRLYAAAIRACPGTGEVVSASAVRRHAAEAAPHRTTRPTYEQLRVPDVVGPLNQMAQHPPLYYRLLSSGLRVERNLGGSHLSLDQQLGILRLVNVLLVAPLPLLCWWAARRLGTGDVVASTAALVPFAVPELLHIGSTINNDNLLTLLAGILVVLLAGVVRGDLSRRTALAIGVTTGLALLTKAFAVVLPPAVAVAYVVGYLGTKRRRPAAQGLVIAGVVAAAIAGWWYLGNVLRGDGLSPSIENVRYTAALRRPGFHPDVVGYARSFASLFTERFWGWFGWYTVRLSLAVIIGATVLLVACVVAGLVGAPRVLARDRRDGSDQSEASGGERLRLVVLLLPAVLLLAFVALRAWTLYTRTSLMPFIQGRYLFASLVGIAVVVAIGAHRLLGRWACAALLVWGAVMQVDALRRILSGYWGPDGGGPRSQLRAVVAWNPWPGVLLAVGAALLVAAGAWLVVEVVRLSRSPSSPNNVDPPVEALPRPKEMARQ